LHSSKPALSPSPSESIPTSTTSATTPITSIAKQGSNQLSLEQPRNRAGACNATPIFHWVVPSPHPTT
jgi:NADH dehydrogenase (ubiquinone) Fe-S protein 7